MADFYAARRGIIPPLPWLTFSPAFSMGMWLDRSGMGRPALVGAVMTGLGSIYAGTVVNEWELYFAYGVMLGLFARGTQFSPLMANVTRWFDNKGRGRAIGIVGSGQAVGGAIWPPLFQYMNDAMGWRETAFWYGVIALCVMVPLALVLWREPPGARTAKPAPVPPPAAPPPATLGGAGTAAATAAPAAAPMPREALLETIQPNMLQFSLCVAIVGCCVAMSLPLAHVVSHASDLGFEPQRGAEMLSLMLICGAVASFFGVGYLCGRHGGLWSLFVFSAIQAAVLGALAFVDSLVSLYLVAALFGLGYGGVLPSYPIIIREFLPARVAGRRTGFTILFGGFGMAIGAWLGGFVYDVVGSYAPAFLIGVLFNVGNLFIIGSLIVRARAARSLATAAAAQV